MSLTLVPAFTIIDAPQRSEEWRSARLGRLTGSRASDMLAKLKDPKAEAAGRRNLRVQLVLERLTGRCQESGYCSPAMQQGTDREVDAVALYEAVTGELLTKTGFLSHNTLMVGVSLDGHVGDFEGIVELKCPIPATHLDYLRTGTVPGEYHKQIVHGLWISGAQWCDWLSYNPDFPAPLDKKLVRVERNEQEITSYALAAALFLSEVQAELDLVKGLR